MGPSGVELGSWMHGFSVSLCVPSARNLPGVRPQRMASVVWRNNRLPHPLLPGASTLVRRPDVSGELGVPFSTFWTLSSKHFAFCSHTGPPEEAAELFLHVLFGNSLSVLQLTLSSSS